MNSCIDFIEERSGEQQAILIYLYELFLQWEGVRPRMAFGIPFFYGKKWICYLNPLKDGGVEVVFTRARSCPMPMVYWKPKVANWSWE